MSRPTAFASTLKRIMQQQLATGRALLALAEDSERAIIAGDTRTLDSIVPQQRTLLEQQSQHENLRLQATAELTARLGMDQEPTLSSLLPLVSPSDAVALAILRTQIMAIHRRMESQNKCNAQLLDNALGFVKFNLEALTTAALKPARYGVNMAQLSAPSFYIDSKA